VAGALKDSVRLGDIVVATHVYAYHGGAVRTGGPTSRPRVWEIDHALEQTARRLARGHGDGPAIHFGPVASGEILHDVRVSEPLRWIREHYDDALAIEMEAAGVAKAGHLSPVPVAVVRAISDRADGTKAGRDDDGRRQRAVGNAASFAVALAGELITQRRAGRDAGQQTHDVRVKTKAGRHGAVAGSLSAGVHNYNTRPGRSSGPGREE
jgi:nucleoside phosphorylase